ncbi:Ff.00g099320.m01.CDS01 [Fusarium sp. VM40]|nr:Ff.00g099320.m01.CDS01 [Fusarium sp. VM40]
MYGAIWLPNGNAGQFAMRFAKEARERYGFDAIAANIQDYNPTSIEDVPDDKLVVFVRATYGEGKPTDSAVVFHEYLSVEASSGMVGTLHNLNYAVFGLGNRTYEFFNAMCRNVDKHLQTLGGQRIGAVGEGDEAQGTLEEDFLAWKKPLWAELVQRFQLEEAQNHQAEPSLIIQDINLKMDSPGVFTGQHHSGEQSKTVAFGPENSTLVAINSSYDLFRTGPRNCLHLDLDLADSVLKYETGDHVAIWPINSNKDVDRLLRILGLTSQRHKVIELRARDFAAPVSFPSPTTYDALVRFYIDICGPVSRQACANVVDYAPNEAAKAEVLRLSQDKEYFRNCVTIPARNLGQILETSGQGLVWDKLPFPVIVEFLQRLIPRRYSISSSASEEPFKISITAVVEQKAFDQQEPFLGAYSNYLLALKHA